MNIPDFAKQTCPILVGSLYITPRGMLAKCLGVNGSFVSLQYVASEDELVLSAEFAESSLRRVE